MYSWLWRRLPGPWPLKVVCCVALALGLVVLLFLVVFPWLDPRLPFNHVTVTAWPGAPVR